MRKKMKPKIQLSIKGEKRGVQRTKNTKLLGKER